MMKSVKFRTAAKVIFTIGWLAFILSSITYCVLCMPEVLNLPFEWQYLAITAGGALLIVIVAGILLAFGDYAEKQEDLEFRLMEAQAIADASEAERIAAELMALEAQAAREETPAQAPRKKILPLSKKDVSTAKKVGKVLIPVVAVCILGGLTVRAAKKHSKNKKKAAVRRAIFDLLD
ncbi:MAG: hypothetical protein IKC31_01050 [Clostridia bacterium]|nr:hypothetical protein [Clostridia bacterium]